MNIPLIDDHEKKPLENQGPVAPTDGGMAWMCGAQQLFVLVTVLRPFSLLSLLSQMPFRRMTKSKTRMRQR